MNAPLMIVGSGGHAKVVLATCRALGRTVRGILDDDPDKLGQEFCGCEVLGKTDDWESFSNCQFMLAFGSNEGRRDRADSMNVEWATLVHPAAVVDDSVSLGSGTVVFANGVVQPDTVVGNHSILNTSCSVDHDCELGAFVHVAPGAHISGGVTVGVGTLIGVGASVRPTVAIGNWVTVGAGSAVVGHVLDGETVAGVPAKPLVTRSSAR